MGKEISPLAWAIISLAARISRRPAALCLGLETVFEFLGEALEDFLVGTGESLLFVVTI